MKAPWWIALVAVGVGVSATRAQEAYPLSIPVPRGAAAPVYKRLAVTARDGIKLIVHEWAPPKPVAGKPVALFLHGIGMHGEPYGAVAAGFTSTSDLPRRPDSRVAVAWLMLCARACSVAREIRRVHELDTTGGGHVRGRWIFLLSAGSKVSRFADQA